MKSGQLIGQHRSPVRFSRLIMFAAILGLIHGCASREFVQGSPAGRVNLEKVLFVPMKNMARVHGENTGIISPFTGKYFMTGRVADPAELFFTDQMMNAVKNRKGFLLLPVDQAQGANAELLAEGQTRLNEKSMLARLGQKAGADAVLAGGIYRFEERVGTAHSAESPAAVAFEVCLISTGDGSILWSESYTERQISLSENLFELGAFIRRKARWVTAEEMASFALAEMMRGFPE